MLLRPFWRGVRALVRRDRADAEARAEIEHFLEESAREYECRGLAPGEAHRGAQAEMGSAASVRQQVRTSGWEFALQSWAEDFWRGGRLLWRRPGFAAGTVLVLALGVGANAAAWSLLHATMVRPLPYADPDRLVALWTATPAEPDRRGPWTGYGIQDLRDRTTDLFSSLAAVKGWQGNLEPQLDLVLDDRAERLRGAIVTPEFFEVLGVSAALGRTFDRADEAAGRGDLVVLSDRLWRRAFGADPSVVGRSVQFVAGRADRGPRSFTVVGVLPRAFKFTYPLETEIWVIDSWSNVGRVQYAITHTAVVARLRPAVGLVAARARMSELDEAVFGPGRDPQFRTISHMEPVTEWVTAESRVGLWLLGGVAALLLVITCVTVANSLFVQVAIRRADLAVRAALGAGRWRLVRQLVAEGAALAVAGALAGTLLAILLLPVLRAVLPASIPRSDEVGINGWWLVFAVGAATVSTILAAVAPAWHGAKADLVTAVKSVNERTSGDRAVLQWRRLLVGVQALVAVMLLTGAVLLLASFWRLTHMPLGFDAERVMTLEMRLLDQKYRSAEALSGFQESLLARVRAISGVLDAGITSAVPFRGVDFTRALRPVGGTRRTFGNGRYVDDAYFRVMNIPLVRGRVISPDDGPSRPPVAVVSRAFALDMFGTEEAVGREIEPFLDAAPSTPVQVVGVVGDTRYSSYEDDPYPAVYISRTQDPSELICLVVRVSSDAGNIGAALVGAVREIDPAVPAMNVTTVEQILDESVADRRFYTAVTTTFGALALMLTAVGLVVVVSRAVVERRRELSLRVALGADPVRLHALVVRQSLWPVVAGTLLGLLAASTAVQAINVLLFQVDARSGAVYGAVALLVIAVSAAAAFVPAMASTRVQPAEALRAE